MGTNYRSHLKNCRVDTLTNGTGSVSCTVLISIDPSEMHPPMGFPTGHTGSII
jgi:hypothetical protein